MTESCKIACQKNENFDFFVSDEKMNISIFRLCQKYQAIIKSISVCITIGNSLIYIFSFVSFFFFQIKNYHQCNLVR